VLLSVAHAGAQPAADEPEPPPAKDALQACFDAYTKGQKLARIGRFMAAVKTLEGCTKSECEDPILMGKCSAKLKQVVANTPAVIFDVVDGAGADVLDATLTIDGQEHDYTQGLAVKLDPGTHMYEVVPKTGETVSGELKLNDRGEIKRLTVRLGQPDGDSGGTVWVAAAPLLTLGAIGVIAGGILMGLASGKESDADSKLEEIKQMPGLTNPDRPCDPAVTGCAEIRDLRTAQDDLANAGFWPLLGGSAVLAGTLIYIAVAEATRGGSDSDEAESAWSVIPLLDGRTAGAALSAVW